MRRAVVFLALTLALGCNRAPTVVIATPAPPPPFVDQAAAPPAVELTPQEQYDAAMWRAASLLAERQLPEALAAFRVAQTAKDTEEVRGEIARMQLRIDTLTNAERTANDIRDILKAGKPDEAALLAATALAQFGDGAAAESIGVLKRQADALVTATLDRQARTARFRADAEAAARDNNLRAALLAYEQALTDGTDEALGRQADAIRTRLTKYDDARRRASELRRDATHIEDALAAYREAAQAWDTLQVRQEIDDCTLALQSRRDRLAVADFETRGEVGLPHAGKTFAEELLPAFKARFDVAERDQIGRVLDELRLAAADITASEHGRTEFARLAKVRYLVVGSITPLSGVTVHARLVDVRTGLVVQTARVSAPTPEAVIRLAPQLAAMLQMTDEQRLAYEQQLARHAAPPPVVAQLPTIPPPPVYVPATPPPPVVVVAPRPPNQGGIVFEDFQRLPPVAAPAAAIALTIGKDHRARGPALAVALELGDNLFRRGRFAEAHVQFQLALDLSPGQPDIQVRLDRCKPHLPPAPIAVRPRLAVLDFVALGNPAAIPNGAGSWTAEQLAPYLCPPYDAADRDELYWYMGRLGLTLRDVVIDPLARLYLGRAMNVRFFVLGTLRATPGGIDVAAHLLDAETGARLGTAETRVANQRELKLQLAELAHCLLLDPDERARQQAEAARVQTLLAQAQQQANESNWSVALNLVTDAGRILPGNVQVQVLFQQFDRKARQAEIEAARRAELQRQQALVAEAQRRQRELAQAAEAARVAAAQQAAAVAAAERQRQRDVAHTQLVAQARAARDAQNLVAAAQLFDSALAIQRRDDIAQEVAAVRTRIAEQARVRAAEEAATRERALREQREAELVKARAQIEAERQRRAAEDVARRTTQDRIRAEADRRRQDVDRQTSEKVARLLQTGREAMTAGRFDAAVSAFQQAKTLAPGSVEAQAGLDQAEQARLDKLAAERKRMADAAKAREDAAREPEPKTRIEPATKLPPAQPPTTITPPPLPPPLPPTPPPLPKRDEPKVTPKAAEPKPVPQTPPPLPKSEPKVTPPLPRTPPPPKSAEPKPSPKTSEPKSVPPTLPSTPKPETKVSPPPLPKPAGPKAPDAKTPTVKSPDRNSSDAKAPVTKSPDPKAPEAKAADKKAPGSKTTDAKSTAKKADSKSKPKAADDKAADPKTPPKAPQPDP